MRLPPPLFRAAHYLYRAKWRLLRPITTGVRVMVLNGDQVLLIRHTYQRGWFMPGGGLKRNETLEEAARRELREETGLRADVDGFVGWSERIDGQGHYVILTFAVTVTDAPELAAAGDDAAAVAWVPLTDVAGHDLVAGLADFLAVHGVVPRRAD